ncbi:hypothetical protein BGW41_007888, partial [Actinomortierella wolfii]
MGVKRSFQALHREGRLELRSQDKITLGSENSRLRVDVCSTHYALIRNIYSIVSNLDDAHSRLERGLQDIGAKDVMRIYVDGQPAVEKQGTHADRDKARSEALIKADAAIFALESRLAKSQRIRKHHIKNANKYLQQAFHWPLEYRQSFVEYMSNKGYNIVLCPTEADVLIAAECQTHDAVVSCDSDMLFYRNIPVFWRPVGYYKSRRFIKYKKSAILETLGLSPAQLTALAILSGNDYIKNIPYLAFETNLKLIKDFEGDEKSIVQQYLAHDKVKRQIERDESSWTEQSYADAIKVFVELQQDISDDRSTVDTATTTYATVCKRMNEFNTAFEVFKKEAYETRKAK